jgi:hypothetical protein
MNENKEVQFVSTYVKEEFLLERGYITNLAKWYLKVSYLGISCYVEGKNLLNCFVKMSKLITLGRIKSKREVSTARDRYIRKVLSGASMRDNQEKYESWKQLSKCFRRFTEEVIVLTL